MIIPVTLIINVETKEPITPQEHELVKQHIYENVEVWINKHSDIISHTIETIRTGY